MSAYKRRCNAAVLNGEYELVETSRCAIKCNKQQHQIKRLMAVAVIAVVSRFIAKVHGLNERFFNCICHLSSVINAGSRKYHQKIKKMSNMELILKNTADSRFIAFILGFSRYVMRIHIFHSTS